MLTGNATGQTIAFQGGETGDNWGFTSTGASALAESESTQPLNKVTGVKSLVVGGNTGGGACFGPPASGNGPAVARTFSFDWVDVSNSTLSTRTLVFNWGNRYPVCSGTGWDSGEDLVFKAFYNNSTTPAETVTIVAGSSNAPYSIQANQFTRSIPPCVWSFRFEVSITTNRADELLFIDNVRLSMTGPDTPLPQPSPITGNDTLCAGSTETYSVIGEAGLNYTWSGLPTGASFTTPNGTATSNSMTINWGTAPAGTYTISVFPSNSCGTKGTPRTLDVTILPPPTPVTISGPTSICAGQTITLTSSYASGNSWLPNGETTPSISVTGAGTYTVNVATTCGTITASHTVTSNTSTPAAITASGPTTFCPGGSITLTSNAASGNSWSPGNQTTPSITVSTAGTYTLTVTDVCGTSTASETITVLALPTATITPNGPTAICAGNSVQLTASGGDTYLWSPTNETTPTITVSSSGSYTVTATNQCGQAVSGAVNVTVTALPTAQISGNASYCEGQQTVLTASGGNTYQWSPTNETTASITVTSPGSYTVTSFNQCGQATSAPFTVTEIPLPVPVISGVPNFCPGGQTVLTAAGGDTYLWTPLGQTTASITVTTAGTYTVTVFNQCGQTTSGPINVTLLPLPNAQINGATSFCAGTQEVLTASGGTSYSWSPTGETTPSITISTAGTYTVTAANNCGTDVASITVTTTSVTASFTANPVSGMAPLPVSFTNTSSAGIIGSAWDFGDGNSDLAFSPTHLYEFMGDYIATLTVVDAQGCTDSYSLTISVLDLPSAVVIPNVFTPNGDHVNDVFAVTYDHLEQFSLQIMNRWGNVMLEINDPKLGWDGTVAGEPATEGTYFYRLTATGSDKKNYDESGFFVLQR